MHKVAYRFEQADIVDARLHAYTTLPFVRVVRLLPYALVAFGLLVAFASMSEGVSYALSAAAVWFIFGFGLIALTLLGDRWITPRSVRRALARDKHLQGEMIVSWGAEAIQIQTEYGQTRWPWGDFARWQESKGGLLLWQGSQVYNYLPKRVLSDDQLADLRAHLTAALGPQGKRRK
jgi:hypothetical protein